MKKIFLTSIFLAIVIFLSAALPARYVLPILMYHNINEKKDNLSVSPGDFEKEMKFLKERKYNVIKLSEALDLMIEKKKIPYKTVVITFDDGRKNNFTGAYPLLKKYNMPATMFVIPNHCDWPDYLSREQLKEMSENNIEIASHTLNDVWLPACGDKKLTEELIGSKRALKQITGKRVDVISYPLGGFNERVRLAVMKAGFKGACAIMKTGRHGDIYALKRIKISSKNAGNLFVFWLKTSGYYVWLRELQHKLSLRRKIRRWIKISEY